MNKRNHIFRKTAAPVLAMAFLLLPACQSQPDEIKLQACAEAEKELKVFVKAIEDQVSAGHSYPREVTHVTAYKEHVDVRAEVMLTGEKTYIAKTWHMKCADFWAARIFEYDSEKGK